MIDYNDWPQHAKAAAFFSEKHQKTKPYKLNVGLGLFSLVYGFISAFDVFIYSEAEPSENDYLAIVSFIFIGLFALFIGFGWRWIGLNSSLSKLPENRRSIFLIFCYVLIILFFILCFWVVALSAASSFMEGWNS